ncbi:family 20 glycosylhydrolase [Zunongwangia sp. F297]|uniref:beta-N-acetylhexosaminidase n=1 Tax=Autumnicola edwardsiae TaxID=3075594 RepID=A0ABU3CVR1_9FLAO|nr:family 20 glycosylhydrolase [Zunongwangia sp. F297]MDT0650351.1 family 20 glycosylhydrolase [Zunongwangia sp. F297]
MDNKNLNKKQFLIRNTIIAIFGLALFLTLAFSSRNFSEKDMSKESLIPIPVQIENYEGNFTITPETVILISEDEEEMRSVASYLSEFLSPATGFELPVKQNSEENKNSGNIILSLSENSQFQKPEAYTLEVTAENVQLQASTPEGLFRGIQTLRQLIPPEVESDKVQNTEWNLSSGKIEDHPQYSYRGAMLDVSRHFFSVNEVKQYIDFLAAYKMNKLHLHLSDDQGWRIEIKKWPKLTSIGGSREVGDTEGGFYTQEDYKEIVAYAQKHYITVIPEIDMPGHTNAALASYPQLNCDDKAPELYTGIEVGFSSLCVNKEITYEL